MPIVEHDMHASDASILVSNFKYVPCDEQGNETGKPVDYTSIRSDFNNKQGDDSMDKKEMLTTLSVPCTRVALSLLLRLLRTLV